MIFPYFKACFFRWNMMELLLTSRSRSSSWSSVSSSWPGCGSWPQLDLHRCSNLQELFFVSSIPPEVVKKDMASCRCKGFIDWNFWNNCGTFDVAFDDSSGLIRGIIPKWPYVSAIFRLVNYYNSVRVDGSLLLYLSRCFLNHRFLILSLSFSNVLELQFEVWVFSTAISDAPKYVLLLIT